jgi:hypothetical protein
MAIGGISLPLRQTRNLPPDTNVRTSLEDAGAPSWDWSIVMAVMVPASGRLNDASGHRPADENKHKQSDNLSHV